MYTLINVIRPFIVISISIPVNIIIFTGILLCTLIQKKKYRYGLAQISARMLLFLSGIKVNKIQNLISIKNCNAYYLGNFIGIESLPALISVINEPTCLILRWFNFYTPIFGWAFYLLNFIPFSNKISKVLSFINNRLEKEYSVINFPAGYVILHRTDSKTHFKSIVLRPLKSNIKIIPFAIIENELADSFWFRSIYTISFLESQEFDSNKSRLIQIEDIERKVRNELFYITLGE
ncbi:hypothetical protein LPTSP2_38630 [Leptospira ellinghausenii]|uniref:Uncharacterized protein n=1 Tax=Leptospira ellinghausenii TaxID=1917822 RepID=A0A2P2DJ20_9LEPT|nr:hypothetical protein [Leptospira ellinghausenii]GBF44560.1 hypothetical protein LPTSP2_38630 [Leptospira ellinghausenii]